MNWASRHYKALMRDYQLNTAQSRTCAIVLPGWDEEADTGCLCVQRGLEIGGITRDTVIIAVERRRDLIGRIAAKLSSFDFTTPPYLHAGELADLKLDGFPAVDFAMIDLLGALDEPVAHWIEHDLGPALLPGGTITLTLARTARNSRFMGVANYAWKTNPELRTLALTFASQYGITDDAILLHLVNAKACLANYNYNHQRVQMYRDSANIMLACRFDNIRPAKRRSWPTVQEVLSKAVVAA